MRKIGRALFVTASIGSACYLAYALAKAEPGAAARWWRHFPFDIALLYGFPLALYIDACVAAKRRGTIWLPVVTGLLCLFAGVGASIALWNEVIHPFSLAIAAQRLKGVWPGTAFFTIWNLQPVLGQAGIIAGFTVAILDIGFGVAAIVKDLPKALKGKVTP